MTTNSANYSNNTNKTFTFTPKNVREIRLLVLFVVNN